MDQGHDGRHGIQEVVKTHEMLFLELIKMSESFVGFWANGSEGNGSFEQQAEDNREISGTENPGSRLTGEFIALIIAPMAAKFVSMFGAIPIMNLMVLVGIGIGQIG